MVSCELPKAITLEDFAGIRVNLFYNLRCCDRFGGVLFEIIQQHRQRRLGILSYILYQDRYELLGKIFGRLFDAGLELN